MPGLELIWLVFLFTALQPVIARQFLQLARQTRLDQIQKRRGSRVIALIHREETMSFFGIPLLRYIDMQDSEEVLRAIHMTDDRVPLDIILHTPGGLVLASTQIARALRSHPARVTVFVPHMAMSGGTLIALAADEVVMSEHSAPGPVDPQIRTNPAASIIDAVAQKPIAEVDDQTLIDADIARKAVTQLQETVRAVVSPGMPETTRDSLTDALTSGRWTHDFPLFAEDAGGWACPSPRRCPRT